MSRQTGDLLLAEVERLDAENNRLRTALKQLEEWDMLTLAPNGMGVATADAPWARKLIAEALRGQVQDHG